MASTTLIEYTDTFFDDHIPDGRFISGTFDIENDWIIVYQAFNRHIADYAVKHQEFIGNTDHYSTGRMTWIKPNFLWMMYRAGWGHKDKNQSNILAIFVRLSGSGFIDLIKNSKLNPGQPDRVNLQWDPHHAPNGDKFTLKRAVQLGLKGSFNLKSFHENILKIEDITDFVKEQHERRQRGDSFFVPKESVLEMADVIGDNHLQQSDVERIKLGEQYKRYESH